ncbi:MAG: IclR family transcriptional regulator [archaeon]
MNDSPNRSIVRAATIVEELVGNDGLGVTELANRLDMPVSTVHDYLRSLADSGYVTSHDGNYSLTTKFLEVGHRQLRLSEVYGAAASELDALARGTEEHVTLMVEEDLDGVLLAVVEGERAVDFIAYPGAKVPLHATAPGKAILAHLPDDRLDAFLETKGLPAITQNTITDAAELRRQLDAIRDRGYSVDVGERIAGMVLVAAPVLDRDDRVRGAICVAGPRDRFDEERRREIAQRVMEYANVVQVKMDYS